MTVTAIALKVCASALKIFPQFNASIDLAKEEIVYKQYINIGVAVDTDRGLLVPVIRDVDKKNIVELAAELTQFSKKARDKKLTLAEMEGGTFTITNLGGIGGTGFSPIVNYPEVAILGLSRSSMEPVWLNGKFEPRLVLPLSLVLRPPTDRRRRRRPLSALDRGGVRAAVLAVGSGIEETRNQQSTRRTTAHSPRSS